MLKIKYLATGLLIPYANNSRTHTEQQIKQVAASIQEFGFTNPILIDEKNGIIAGHGRVLAAELVKLKEVPTIKLEGLSEAQKKAYVIADNKLALNAGWSYELLKLEFDELKALDFNIDVIGFNQKEIDGFIGFIDNEAPDDFVEFDENIDTEHRCPKCGYEWSGKRK